MEKLKEKKTVKLILGTYDDDDQIIFQFLGKKKSQLSVSTS